MVFGHAWNGSHLNYELGESPCRQSRGWEWFCVSQLSSYTQRQNYGFPGEARPFWGRGPWGRRADDSGRRLKRSSARIEKSKARLKRKADTGIRNATIRCFGVRNSSLKCINGQEKEPRQEALCLLVVWRDSRNSPRMLEVSSEGNSAKNCHQLAKAKANRTPREHTDRCVFSTQRGTSSRSCWNPDWRQLSRRLKTSQRDNMGLEKDAQQCKWCRT